MPSRTRNTARQRTRQRLAAARSDIRGVALQTVIVIVVLLVIAGSVSAVLLSRSSDVVRTLEDQSIGGLTEQSCPITRVGGVNGEVVTAVAASPWGAANDKGCFWQSQDDSSNNVATIALTKNISHAQCAAAGGGELREGTNLDAAATNAGCIVKLDA